MKPLLLSASLLSTLLTTPARADSMEERRDAYRARQEQAKEQKQAEHLARQKQIFVEQVKRFAAGRSGLLSEPKCRGAVVGSTVGQHQEFPMSAVMSPNVIFVISCTVHLKNDDYCNVVMSPMQTEARAKVSAGCYDNRGGYREVN